jgi:hypothetical protein
MLGLRREMADAHVLDHAPAKWGDTFLGHAILLSEARLLQGGFGAVGEGFVVDDRGVEGRDEFDEIGLAFDKVCSSFMPIASS